jgi:glycosyltransferase involved in cell wall biosynthesis
MSTPPLLSVWMTTYNHRDYIATAIDSVLAQETSFPIELVIGEDCSTDGTREICISFRDKFPDKINLILPEKNLGLTKNGLETLKKCSGKYIAILEGDDYWTDRSKLQTQVDFLEKHPGYSVCFHEVNILNDRTRRERKSRLYNKPVATYQDLVRGPVLHTPSCVFRNNFNSNPPEWFWSLPIGDYPLHLYNAQFGDFKYFDKSMAVYRVGKSGTWSLKNEIYKKEKWIELLLIIKDKYSKEINRGIEDQLIMQLLSLVMYSTFKGYEFSSFGPRAFKIISESYSRYFKLKKKLEKQALIKKIFSLIRI